MVFSSIMKYFSSNDAPKLKCRFYADEEYLKYLNILINALQ